MADQHIYGHDDIQRYLQQKMSQQEMYAFEKAMMDDPFLADAIEGFATGDPALANEHLSAIENNIKNGKPGTAAVPIKALRSSWWRVAAIVLVIVTGGILSYTLLIRQQTDKASLQEIALNKQPAPGASNDTVKASNSLPGNVESLPETELFKNKPATSSPIIYPGKESALAVNDKNQPPAAGALDEFAQKDMSLAMKTEEGMNNYSAEGKTAGVTAPSDEKSLTDLNAPTNDAISGSKNKYGPALDDKGKLTSKASDSTAIAAASAGYTTAKPGISGTFDDGRRRQATAATTTVLSEAVASKSPAYKIDKATDALSAVTGAEPKGGWNSFNHYIAVKTDSARIVNNNANYKTKIEVAFSINKKGEPIKVKALNAPNNAVGKQAENIIKEGPLWSRNNKNERVKVVIPF